MRILFSENAWNDYQYWQAQDKKTLKRINRLINDIGRTPYQGLGQPEALKYAYQGVWSRRINSVDRILYSIAGEDVVIYSCKGHYDD